VNRFAVLLALILAAPAGPSRSVPIDVARERARVMPAAQQYLTEEPITITASSSPRSTGGRHDFFSEGDYWWPDPQNPDGPYIQRDGISNPANFNEHRRYLMRLSMQVPALTAAWKLTGDPRYAAHAVKHLKAWFVETDTRMNPNLQYAQAIHGRFTGRGTGIIDTIHLVEVARAAEVLDSAPVWDTSEKAAVRTWFTQYLEWLTTHPYGIAERDAKNNHGTCWVMQVAAFAHFTGDQKLLEYSRDRFKTVLVPNQIAADGSFPEELRRTKPYGYSLFNLDAMATLARTLSTPSDNLWTFQLPDGRGLQRAMQYMVPFIRDKKSWPKPPDVMYDSEWPMRHPSLLFAGIALNEPDDLALWSTLPADSKVDEVIRNFFIRQPVLWIDTAGAGLPPSPRLRQTAVALAETGQASQVISRLPITIASPGGRIRFELDLRSQGRLAYRVTLKGRPVIERSPLGIVVDGVNLAKGAAIGTVDRTRGDERYPTRGVHAMAANRFNGATIEVSHTSSGTHYTIEVRAFDDGVAFRYVVPGAATAQRTPDEATVFNFPAGSTVWYHDLDGHYEGVHEKRDVEDVDEGDWAAPPLTARLPDGLGYASVTEAALVNYAGMALQADRRGGFAARLGHAVPASYPYRLRYPALDVKRLEQPATLAGAITTPWRVVLMGADLNTLVNSDVITNLSPPPDPALFPQGLETPWLKPGRAVWRYLDGGENTFEGIKDFSELAGKLGFEYQVVEGLWRRWTDDQLRELVSFSNERHVGILLWVHSRDLRDAAARRALFEKLHAFGVAGVKVDFFDHEAKEVIDLYHDILRETAANHLICDFHGANKPAGESRTWPNELTREGVYGFEHRAQAWATHNTTLPFTRYLAGHGDYTPVVFGDRRKETSWPHQIATAAIFTSPLLVYGGHPQSLLDNPAAELIETLPSTWDETIVLPGSGIGEAAVFARRKGEEWFIAVLNGPEARTLKIELKFLGPATYHAVLVRDDPDNAAAERIERTTLARQGALTIGLRAGGGFIARLIPVKRGAS
jgi:alpha-glucosidase